MKGIWKSLAGLREEDSLLSLSGCSPRVDALEALPECAYPLSRAIQTEQVLDRMVIRIPCETSERFYGLGLNFRSLCLNHQVRHLRMDHFRDVDNGRTHAPVPFYVSDAGYGVFVDTARPVSFYMGGTVRTDAENPPEEINRGRGNNWQCEQSAEFVEISFAGQGAAVYIIAGQTMTQVVSRFNLLCGGGCLPPKWGLGYWHRTHYQTGASEAMADLDAYAQHGYSVDVLGLEPGWQSRSYPGSFEFDEARYPDPAGFVQALGARGVRVNLWENFFISRHAKFYREILPHCGTHQVWGGAVPDVTLPQARDILTRHHQEAHLSIGISGYKIDECDGFDEWLWPDHARFPSGHGAVVVRNVFGVRLQRMIDGWYQQCNRRTYGLARASNAGGVSLPFCLYNDCYAFDEYLMGMLSSGFCGALWTPEIRGANSAEALARRFQLAALSPMLLFNAWAEAVKPWDFPAAEAAVRDAIALRRSLLPYLYDAFARYHFHGVPPFRAVMMDYPSLCVHSIRSALDHTAEPYARARQAGIFDEYLIGEWLLFAPVRPGERERDVHLPPGVWHDYFTGTRYEGGESFSYECPLERIPLFVKSGSMIPTVRPDGVLAVRCYGAGGEAVFYDDDGETHDCDRGAYALIHCAFHRASGNFKGEFRVESHGYLPGYPVIECHPVG